jgi:hypothetical protein
MLIILTIYVVLAWLAFSKFKLVRWGWVYAMAVNKWTVIDMKKDRKRVVTLQ